MRQRAFAQSGKEDEVQILQLFQFQERHLPVVSIE